MANDTREKILYAALDLFSENGYAAANLQSIADTVGIVKSALYRHFESKEELWDAVFAYMISYYEEHFGSADRLSDIPESTDALYKMTMRMVDFTVHDEKVIRIRRILYTEQFRDDRIRRLSTRYFLEDTRAIFAKVFGEMTDKGVIRKVNADFLALSYTAPITALIHLCDREPGRISEIAAEIDRFIKEFIHTYGV